MNNNFLNGKRFGEKLRKDLEEALGIHEGDKVSIKEKELYFYNLLETCFTFIMENNKYKIIDEISHEIIFNGNENSYQHFCIGIQQSIK